jgi:hypothetical protein
MLAYVMRVYFYWSAFIIIFNQILFVRLIISISYSHLDIVVAFFVDCICRLDYSFFLSIALCFYSLLRNFSDNFICCLLLLD